MRMGERKVDCSCSMKYFPEIFHVEISSMPRDLSF